jgi:hypothetical protein
MIPQTSQHRYTASPIRSSNAASNRCTSHRINTGATTALPLLLLPPFHRGL